MRRGAEKRPVRSAYTLTLLMMLLCCIVLLVYTAGLYTTYLTTHTTQHNTTQHNTHTHTHTLLSLSLTILANGSTGGGRQCAKWLAYWCGRLWSPPCRSRAPCFRRAHLTIFPSSLSRSSRALFYFFISFCLSLSLSASSLRLGPVSERLPTQLNLSKYVPTLRPQ